MTSLLLALAMTATPLAVDGAEATIWVSRLDRMERLVALLERAGRHAVLLRPSSWRSELHPVLALDPARPESLAAAGIDPEGGLTLNAFDDGRLTCVAVADAGKYEQASEERLKLLGTFERRQKSGATFGTATAQGTAVAGYVLKGRWSCATASAGVDRMLARGLKAIQRGPRAPPGGPPAADEVAIQLPGAVSARLTATADAFEARIRGAIGDAPALKPAGPSPYGGVTSSGVLLMRARVAPQGAHRALVRLGAGLLHACPICERPVVAALLSELEGVLTGEVMVRVDRIAPPPGGLTSTAAAAFAVKHASLAQVSRADAASKALEGLMKLGAKRVGQDRYTIAPVNPVAGAILIGLRGTDLYFANDDRALESALEAAGRAKAPARLEHSATAFVDPRLVSRALSQLSVLDLLGSKELAPLVFVSSELGPLLAHSERIDGWLDGDGSAQRGLLRWQLAGEAADAGR